MSPLDRILLMRADEQANEVNLTEGPRHIYEGQTCRWEGCTKLVAYWNKLQMCPRHGDRARRRKMASRMSGTREELLSLWRADMTGRMPSPAEQVLVALVAGQACSKERVYFGWRNSKRESAAKELLAREFEKSFGCRPEDLVRSGISG